MRDVNNKQSTFEHYSRQQVPIYHLTLNICYQYEIHGGSADLQNTTPKVLATTICEVWLVLSHSGTDDCSDVNEAITICFKSCKKTN